MVWSYLELDELLNCVSACVSYTVCPLYKSQKDTDNLKDHFKPISDINTFEDLCP